MKLKLALGIGQDCGLETVGEALFNIRLHATNLFLYEEAQAEWDELVKEFKGFGFNEDDKIEDCLIKL